MPRHCGTPKGGQRRRVQVPRRIIPPARTTVGTLRFARPDGAAGLPHLTLIADRAEMFVDAEHDQDEFRGDAREHHADHDAGD